MTTTPPGAVAGALLAVQDASRARHTAHQAYVAADTTWRATIRDAITTHGTPVAALCAATGLSRARIYQIRDGKR